MEDNFGPDFITVTDEDGNDFELELVDTLEHKGIISRQRSLSDRRRVELRLMPAGFERYEAAHRRVLDMVDRLIIRMGEERVRSLLPLLRQAAEIFDQIQQEG